MPLEERREAGAPPGEEGGAGWPRGAWAQNQFWELVRDRPRGCPQKNQRFHVGIRVQRYWGRCECAGSVVKGLGREPLNWKRQLPHDWPSMFLQGGL